MSFIILHDCPNCKIQGIWEESFQEDSQIPTSKICSFCGFGSEEHLVFQDRIQVEEAIHAWMLRIGAQDIHSFCRLHFYGLTPEELYQKLLQEENIESSFDVLEYLFPGFAGGGVIVFTEEELSLADPEPTEEPYRYIPNKNQPVEACALAAVMLADGKIHPTEEQLLDQYLVELNVLPLKEENIRPWLPFDLPVPKEPERLVRMMLEVALVDKELDETEWRVIREFARYWGCDRKKLEAEKNMRSAPKRGFWSQLWSASQKLLFKETP